MFRPATGARTKKLVARAALANHREAFQDVDKNMSNKEKRKAEAATLKKAAQAGTRAARKRGGFARGEAYDVEELAGMENYHGAASSSGEEISEDESGSGEESDSSHPYVPGIEESSVEENSQSEQDENSECDEFEPRPRGMMPSDGSSGDSLASNSDGEGNSDDDSKNVAVNEEQYKPKCRMPRRPRVQQEEDDTVREGGASSSNAKDEAEVGNPDKPKPKRRMPRRPRVAEGEPKADSEDSDGNNSKEENSREENSQKESSKKETSKSKKESSKKKSEEQEVSSDSGDKSESSGDKPVGIGKLSDEELVNLQPKDVKPSDSEAVQGQLVVLLRTWANDGSPLQEQASRIRKMLATWHPDRQHRHGVDAVHVAKEIFQFLQETISRVLEEKGLKDLAEKLMEQDAETKKHVDLAAKHAKAAARVAAIQEKEAAKAEKQASKQAAKEKKKAEGRNKNKKKKVVEEVVDAESSVSDVESVISCADIMLHEGPKHPMLRLWPRSHFSITPSPVLSEGGEFYIFGGEWYDGRTGTFYSDLYRANLALGEDGKPAFYHLYSAVPYRPGPTPRSSHQVVGHGKSLYLFGGEWSSSNMRRFRQFGDFWQFDVTAQHWSEVKATGDGPEKRSGHRMCVVGDKMVVFGGYTEKSNGAEDYHSDLHVFDIPTKTWLSANQRGKMMKGIARPSGRAASLFWPEVTTGDVVPRRAWLYGGTRPAKGTRKKAVGLARSIDVLTDLWVLDVPTLKWTQVTIANPQDGMGPGPRSGVASCQWTINKRLFFGGVTDLALDDERRADGSVALFHNDLWSLELPAAPEKGKKYKSARWHQLWSPLVKGVRIQDLLALPDVRSGGGVDVLAVVAEHAGQKKKLAKGPRGRISAQCACVGGYFYVIGGAAESGSKREATLDDMWRIDLTGQTRKSKWDNVLPLSERCSAWFDDDSDEEDSDDEEQRKKQSTEVVRKKKGADPWMEALTRTSAGAAGDVRKRFDQGRR